MKVEAQPAVVIVHDGQVVIVIDNMSIKLQLSMMQQLVQRPPSATVSACAVFRGQEVSVEAAVAHLRQASSEESADSSLTEDLVDAIRECDDFNSAMRAVANAVAEDPNDA